LLKQLEKKVKALLKTIIEKKSQNLVKNKTKEVRNSIKQ
jgi:hypothetical protein